MSSLFILALISGVLVGIIVNYLADVLPRTRKLVAPVCLGCGEPRRVGEFLQGKMCSSCGKKNAIRFWLVLAIEVILSTILWFSPVGAMPFWTSLILLIIFSVMVITDLEFRVILEQMSVAAYIITFIAGWFLHGWLKTVLGGLSGFLIFLALYYLGRLFARRLSRNREEPVDEEALGFGDVHLAGIIGLLTGFPFNLTALLLGIIFGGIVSAGLIVFAVIKKQYQAFQAIPYGPFIILGGLIALYFYL
jgi:leader peptidase (prepilin peptidase) / N-methyltransferase